MLDGLKYLLALVCGALAFGLMAGCSFVPFDSGNDCDDSAFDIDTLIEHVESVAQGRGDSVRVSRPTDGEPLVINAFSGACSEIEVAIVSDDARMGVYVATYGSNGAAREAAERAELLDGLSRQIAKDPAGDPLVVSSVGETVTTWCHAAAGCAGERYGHAEWFSDCPIALVINGLGGQVAGSVEASVLELAGLLDLCSAVSTFNSAA